MNDSDNTDADDVSDTSETDNASNTDNTGDINSSGETDDASDDPRSSDEYIRTVIGSNGTVTVVGVVHDHPSSMYRAKAVVADRDPDVLALELPPLAIPLFRQYADDERVPPVFGGEMSAAIQATTDADVVGIDGPSLAFLSRLAGTLYRTNASLGTTRQVCKSVLSATKQTLVCRAASLLASGSDLRLEVDTPTVYDVDWTDDPERQAADERSHLDRARSVLDVLEPPRAMAVRDATREAHMANRLERLSRDGDVVAVIGLDHLEAVAKQVPE